MSESIKCLVLAVIILAPMFIMSHELSGDEFAKSGVGLAMGAIALGAYKLLENRFKEE